MTSQLVLRPVRRHVYRMVAGFLLVLMVAFAAGISSPGPKWFNLLVSLVGGMGALVWSFDRLEISDAEVSLTQRGRRRTLRAGDVDSVYVDTTWFAAMVVLRLAAGHGRRVRFFGHVDGGGASLDPPEVAELVGRVLGVSVSEV